MSAARDARHDLTGAVALVAGGSRGIGADVARAFGRAGASVVIGARSGDRVHTLAAEITDAGGRAVGVGCDVTDAADAEALVRTAVSSFGRLDCAVNNATGEHQVAPLAQTDPQRFVADLQTNVVGTFLGMKYQIPAMLDGGGGAIVNMASGAALNAAPNLSSYVAGKAGVIGLTKVAALDYAEHGVRVNVVAPGPIRTEHIEAAGTRAQELAAASVPMGRMGTPGDVSDVMVWLCSAGSTYLTGTVIPIAGGQSAGAKPPQMHRPGEPME